MSTGIVIIVWNRPMFIRKAVEAALAVPDSRLLVWDNASNDPATLMELGRLEVEGVEFRHHPENVGRDRAEQMAFEVFAAEGHNSWLSLEDACWPLTGALDEMLAVLGGNGRLGAVGCSLDAGPPVQHHPQEAEFLRDAAMLPEGFGDLCAAGRLWEARQLVPLAHPRWRTAIAVDPFCWAVKADAWRDVGGTDARYWQGWNTLNEFCYLLRQKGLHAAVAYDALCHNADHWHTHVDKPRSRPGWMASGVPEQADLFRKEWQQRGYQVLYGKWGQDAYALFEANYEEFSG
jgi:GT2 family glycosyltransferase